MLSQKDYLYNGFYCFFNELPRGGAERAGEGITGERFLLDC